MHIATNETIKTPIGLFLIREDNPNYLGTSFRFYLKDSIVETSNFLQLDFTEYTSDLDCIKVENAYSLKNSTIISAYLSEGEKLYVIPSSLAYACFSDYEAFNKEDNLEKLKAISKRFKEITFPTELEEYHRILIDEIISDQIKSEDKLVFMSHKTYSVDEEILLHMFRNEVVPEQLLHKSSWIDHIDVFSDKLSLIKRTYIDTKYSTTFLSEVI